MTKRKIQNCCEAMDVVLSADQTKGIKRQTMVNRKTWAQRERFVYIFTKKLTYRKKTGTYINLDFCPFCKRDLYALGNKMRGDEPKRKPKKKARRQP